MAIRTPRACPWEQSVWIAYNVPGYHIGYHIDYQANSNSSTTLSAITHTQLIDFFNTMPTSYPVVHNSITFNEPDIEGYDFDGYMALQTVPIDIWVPNNAPNDALNPAQNQSQYLARPIGMKVDGPYTSRPYTVYYRKGGVWQTLPITLYSESYVDGKSTSNDITHLIPCMKPSMPSIDSYFTTIYADPGTTIYIVDDSADEYNWAVPHFTDYSINTFLNISNVISLTVPDILPYDIVTSKGDVHYSYSLFLKLQVTDAYTTLVSATEEDDMTDMVTYTVVKTDMFNSSSDYPDPVVYDKSNMFSDKKEAWLIDEMLELDIHQPMILTPDDYGDYVLIPVLHPHEYTVQFIDPGTESKIGETSIVYNTSLVELLLTTLGPNYQTTVNDNFAQVLAHTYQTPCVVDSYYIIQNGQHIPYDFTTPVTSDLDIYVKFHTPGLEYHFIFNDYSKTNIRPSSNISDDDAVKLFGINITQGNGETEFRLHIDSAEHDITDMETQYPLFKSITGYTNKYGFDLDAQVDLYLDARKEQTADIHELSTDIELTLSADTLFDSSAYHLTSYNIYSVHNGILYECPVTYDSNTNMFTFKVHQFSPFELVYTTEKNVVPTTLTPSTSSSQSDNNKSETKSETKSEDNTSHNTNSDEQSSNTHTSNNVAPAETAQPIIQTVTETVTNTGARVAQTWDDTDIIGRILLILTALLCILAIIGIPLYSKKHK
ncbi:hypothetical protein [Butyrivibrio sp.]|uniref:hypothetical protein n=1 Tax=Butyrivibrio sp. TaxID=28121 RepID=UPI0025C30BEE|nr:hypothetical protein [Butyrivibrio sp.]MBQ7431281.1 hypothetical protein [Butyrivibrio sp.]MBQ9303496.1 hypothetical protein [Butyrivibrio sp.]